MVFAERECADPAPAWHCLTLDPTKPDDFDRILGKNATPYRGIIHLWSLDATPSEQTTPDSLQADQARICGSILHSIQSIATTEAPHPPKMWLVTRGAQPVGTPIPLAVAQAPVWGLARTFAIEPPGVRCVRIDLPAGVALRRQAVVDPATLIKRLALGAELTVLDPPEQAAAKIGVTDAWIQVQDTAGDQGFVAAWYLSLSAPVGLGPAVETPPAAPPVELHVVTTVPALALRSKPVISPETLIKRMGIGVDLLVIEPSAAAQTKIGANDQWIQVRDPENSEGYVAAWYVKRKG